MDALLKLLSIFCAPLVYLAAPLLFVGHGNYVFYLGEPDFFYLFNSVTLLEGFRVLYIDHPGLPLEWFGALVIGAFKFVHGYSSGLTAISENPQSIFLMTVVLKGWLLAYVSFFFGWVCLIRRVPLPLILLVQVSPLFFPGFFHLSMRVMPETLIFSLSFALASAYVWLLEAPGARDGASPRQFRNVGVLFWCLWGAIIGTLASLKATTWPGAALLLLPLFVAHHRSWRNLGAALTAAAIVFLLFFLPAWHNWPRLIQWFLNLWLHSGKYGEGEQAVATFASLREGLLALSGGKEFFLFALFFGFTCAVGVFFAARTRNFIAAVFFLPLLFSVFVMVKHPEGRYFVGLSPLLSCMLIWAARELRLLVIAFLLVCCVIAVPHWLERARFERLSIISMAQQESSIRRLVNNMLPDCSLTYLTQVAELSHTLFNGSMATEEAWVGRALNEKFPRTSFLSTFSEKIYRYDQVEMELPAWSAFMNKYSCHLFFVQEEHVHWLRKKLKRELVSMPRLPGQDYFKVMYFKGKI